MIKLFYGTKSSRNTIGNKRLPATMNKLLWQNNTIGQCFFLFFLPLSVLLTSCSRDVTDVNTAIHDSKDPKEIKDNYTYFLKNKENMKEQYSDIEADFSELVKNPGDAYDAVMSQDHPYFKLKKWPPNPALNPMSTTDILRMYAEHSEQPEFSVLKHKNCSADIIMFLLDKFGKKHASTIFYAADSGKLNSSQLEKFASNGVWDVIYNKKSTDKIVKMFIASLKNKSYKQKQIINYILDNTKSNEIIKLLSEKDVNVVSSNIADSNILINEYKRRMRKGDLNNRLKLDYLNHKNCNEALYTTIIDSYSSIDTPIKKILFAHPHFSKKALDKIAYRFEPRAHYGSDTSPQYKDFLRNNLVDGKTLLIFAKKGCPEIIFHKDFVYDHLWELSKRKCKYIVLSPLSDAKAEKNVPFNDLIGKKTRFDESLLYYAKNGQTAILLNPKVKDKHIVEIVKLLKNFGRKTLCANSLSVLIYRHRKCGPETLHMLAVKGYPINDILKHPCVSKKTVKYVAENEKLQDWMMKKIIYHKLMDDDIMNVVIKNPVHAKCKKSIIENKYFNSSIAKQFFRTPLNVSEMLALARSDKTPVDILIKLQEDNSMSNVQYTVYKNINYPINRLINDFEKNKRLQSSSFSKILKARTDLNASEIEAIIRKIINQETGYKKLYIPTVIQNPNVSSEFISSIIDHFDTTTFIKIVKHPNLSEDNMLKLLELKKLTGLQHFFFERDNLPVTVLAQIAKNPHNSIRVKLAQYKDTPKSILKELTNDKVASVRNAANKRLSR